MRDRCEKELTEKCSSIVSFINELQKEVEQDKDLCKDCRKFQLDHLQVAKHISGALNGCGDEAIRDLSPFIDATVEMFIQCPEHIGTMAKVMNGLVEASSEDCANNLRDLNS